MIDPALIKNNYARMSDEGLVHLANTERNKLSKIALDILLEELSRRGLDTTNILAAKEVINKAENTIANDNWTLALYEKRAGKTDEEILKNLLDRSVAESQALLIIKRLPNVEYDDPAFASMIQGACSNLAASIWLAIAIIVAFTICMLYFAIQSGFFIFLLVPIIFILVTYPAFKRSRGHLKGGPYWMDIIENQPEDIVWIKPIVTKHKLYYVLTLYKERKFQLYTKDGYNIIVMCNDEQRQEIFFNGIRHYLPHAHIGYSLNIDILYDDHKDDFVNVLQHKGLYTPIDTFK